MDDLAGSIKDSLDLSQAFFKVQSIHWEGLTPSVELIFKIHRFLPQNLHQRICSSEFEA